jgi:integrase
MATEKVNLKLRKDYVDKEGYSSIQLCYQYKQKTLRVNTGVKCKPNNWNSRKQIATSLKPKDSDSILLKLKSDLTNLVTTYFITNKCYPTFQYINENFIQKSEPDEINTNDFFKLLKKYISDKKDLGQTDTAKIYNTLVKNLKGFASEKKIALTVNSFDETVLNDFVIYLVKQKYSNPSIDTKIRKLKAFINHLKKSKVVIENISEFRPQFKKYETSIHTITKEEFEIIKAKDFKNDKRLEYVRDLFLLGCATGLRYSDLIRLSINNFKNKNIEISINKTGEIVLIPLSQTSRFILEKYQTLKPLSNQKANVALKDMLSHFKEFENMVEIVRYSGAKRNIDKKERYKCFSFHCSRRSFITINLQAGTPQAIIQDITGHKSLAQFNKYVNKQQGRAEYINKVF